MFFQWLSIFDLFKRPIYLHFNQYEKNASNLGLIFSLAILILMIIQFSTSDIFYHIKPTVINQDITDNLRKDLLFKNKIFTVSVVDDDSLAYVEDPSIFKISAKNVFMKALPEGGYETVLSEEKKLHLCNETDFISDPIVNQSLGLKNTYCLDHNSFETYGYWDESKLAYFEFQIHSCENSTSDVVCKTSEEISDFFHMKYINLVFADLRLDVQNYTNPLDIKYTNIYELIEPSLNKMMNIFLKEATVLTEDGLIFSKINRIADILFDFYESDFSFIRKNSEEASPIYTCDFYTSREHLYISRNYLTISEVFANLGGFLSFLMVCGYILTYIDNTLNLKVQIMNRLYSFQQANSYTRQNQSNLAVIEERAKLYSKTFKGEDSNKNQVVKTQKQENLNNDSSKQIQMISNGLTGFDNINKKYLEPKQIIEDEPNPEIISEDRQDNNVKIDSATKEVDDLIKPNSLSPSNLNKSFGKKTIFGIIMASPSPKKSIITSDFTKFKKFQQVNNNNLKISLYEYFKFMIRNFFTCFEKKFKEKLFFKAEQKFEYEIDIVNILQRLQDIEKLKKVLLNEKQIALFNLMAKPMIYTESEGNDGMLDINSSKTKNENLKDAINYYKKMGASLEVCDVDQRLFKLLDKNINDFKNHFSEKEINL